MDKSVLATFHKRQQGAALVVALVLVLVSTLLGVSAMQSSDMETQLANNARFQEAAFRAAEAGAESLLTMDNIETAANDLQAVIYTTDSIDSSIAVYAEFDYTGKTAATGYSLGGQNGFRSMKFKSGSIATINAVDSSSRVVQGIERLINSRDN